MIFAGGFATLFAGALVISMANGLVEAACNPLVASLYPDNKTVKLNQFHVWFPGGIVLGGLASFGLDGAGITSWQIKVALILIPTVAYGVLLLGQRFPATEGVRSGVSMGEMFRATLTTPLMLLMLLCMAMTASIELGPGRWIPAVLEAGGMAGILVLVYVNGIMAVMRYWAGPVVHRLSPTGILLASAVISGAGLLWLSFGGSLASVFASATVFAVGVCYFWPTMLGFVSERVPRSGALGLGLMGTMGMAVVGLATSPLMGGIADRVTHEELDQDRAFVVLVSAVEALESEASRRAGSRGRRPQVGAGPGDGRSGELQRGGRAARARDRRGHARVHRIGVGLAGGGAGAGAARARGERGRPGFLPLPGAVERGAGGDLRSSVREGAARGRVPRRAPVLR